MADHVRISKTLSRWLRHRPQSAGLKLDAQGWAEVDAVLAALAVTAALSWGTGLREITVVAGLLAALSLVWVAVDNARLGRVLHHVLEVVGKQLDLTAVKGARP